MPIRSLKSSQSKQNESTPQVAVIHIALASYGLEPFRAFVASYRRHRAGMPHDFIVVFKGFFGEDAIKEYQKVLGSTNYSQRFCDDAGFDIGTYLDTARSIPHETICCLNSRSVILADGWLKLLHQNLSSERVGMVSATASLQSLYSDHVCLHRPADSGSGWRALIRRSWLNTLRHVIEFRPFPNPHLRTNAFMIDRKRLLSAFRGRIRTRRDAAGFENGRGNISVRLLRQGLDLVVVGRDGLAYTPERWRQSATFWSGGQHNLLVADNQTAKYEAAEPKERSILEERAWTPPCRR